MLRIAATHVVKNFQRMYKSLPEETREDFKDFVQELRNGNPARNRRLKKMGGKKQVTFEARISPPRGYRVTFWFKDGLATFLAIGPHDETYRRTP